MIRETVDLSSFHDGTTKSKSCAIERWDLHIPILGSNKRKHDRILHLVHYIVIIMHSHFFFLSTGVHLGLHRCMSMSEKFFC